MNQIKYRVKRVVVNFYGEIFVNRNGGWMTDDCIEDGRSL
jgi:hypothetical protein